MQDQPFTSPPSRSNRARLDFTRLAGLELAEIVVVRRPGRPGDTGSERESGYAPPWQRLDRVAGRRERVGVLAIAEGPQNVGPSPAGGQRRQAGGCELEPGLVAWAGDAEPVVVGLGVCPRINPI